jgi:hypothetical protein
VNRERAEQTKTKTKTQTQTITKKIIKKRNNVPKHKLS